MRRAALVCRPRRDGARRGGTVDHHLRGFGHQQHLDDADAARLKPSVLPVLGYRATPGRSEFKHLARLHGVSVGLYVYRVDENKAHMRLFEYDDGDTQGLLADTALRDDLTELTFRAPGSEEMVTAYCYW